MRVRSKLLLIIVFVSVVPLVVSALTALRVHQKAVENNLTEIHRGAADHAVARGDDYLRNVGANLELLAGRTIGWTTLTVAERQGALWLVYRQFEDAAVVSLLDDTGSGIGSSAYVEGGNLQGHPIAEESVLRAFSQAIPFEAAKQRGLAWGTPFRMAGHTAPFLPVAVSVEGTAGTKWVVAVALSMRTLCANLAPTGASPAITVADASGSVLCSSGPARDVSAPVLALSRSGASGLTRHEEDGKELLVAVSALSTGWVVEASQPVEQAFATSRQLEIQSVIWLSIALVAAIASGLILSGTIIAPIRKLVLGAKRLTEGQLDYRLNLKRGDEFGELAESFDRMSEELSARDFEIRGWNEELQHRVEERTQELTRAQQQLLASHKMAAVSTLAAGAAHEINNPLTSVLGVLQIQRSKAAKFPDRAGEVKLLESAEGEARRIKSIVERMLELGQAQQQSAFRPVSLDEVIRSAVELLRSRIDEKHLDVVMDLAESKPVHASSAELQQAMVHVLRNAIAASPDKGRIRVELRMVQDELVTLSIADQGQGIAAEDLSKIFEPFFTTKSEWRGEGLGLAVTYRILQNHGGTIRAESAVGKGTSIVMTLPVGRKPAHLT